MKTTKDLDLILDLDNVFKVESYGGKTRLMICGISDDAILDALAERRDTFIKMQ